MNYKNKYFYALFPLKYTILGGGGGPYKTRKAYDNCLKKHNSFSNIYFKVLLLVASSSTTQDKH